MLKETGIGRETFYSALERLMSLGFIYKEEVGGFPPHVYYALTLQGERLAQALVPIAEILSGTTVSLKAELDHLEADKSESALARRLELLRVLSSSECDSGRWDDAERHATQLAELAGVSRDIRLEASAHLTLGRLLQKRDRHDEAERHLVLGLKGAEASQAWDAVSDANYLLGSDLERQGRWADAAERFTASGVAAGRIDDTLRGTRAREAHARLLSRRGRHEEALTVFREVVAVYERLHAVDELPRSCLSLGSTASRLKLPEAADWFEKGVDAARRAGDSRIEAYGLTSVAGTWADRRKFAQAERCLERAARIFEDLGERSGRAGVLLNLGNLRALQGRLADADRQYERAVALEREVGNRFGEASAILRRGKLRLSQRRWVEAGALIEDAKRIFTELGSEDRIAQCAEELNRLPLPRVLSHQRDLLMKG